MNAEDNIRSASELLLGELTECIDALDRHKAVEVALDAVSDGVISLPSLYTLVLGPLLARIGSQWQHGRERVWQEHFASHVVRTIVEALYPRVIAEAARTVQLGTTVLLVCPPREQHELGLRMLSDRFELAGWRTVFLGADTPLADVIVAAYDAHADLVAVSVSTVFERVEMRAFIDSLRAALPGVRIAVGGPAFARDENGWADELLDPSEFGLPGEEAGR